MEAWNSTPEDRTATHANWRQSPHSRWSFRNVRQILTTAIIDRRPESFTPLLEATTDIADIAFDTAAGKLSVREALAQSETGGFLVLKNGAVIAEQYGNGMRPHSRHVMFSVSKSVLGMIFGILIDRGKVDPALPVTTYIPELDGTAYEDATVQQLLDMAVAVDFREDYEQRDGDVDRYRRATGWDPAGAADAGNTTRSMPRHFRRGEGPHGQTFLYVSPNTDIAGWVAERATGMSYADIISELLWKPMGAEYTADMTVDRFGVARSAGGLCATLRDMGRVALAMTGHQLLSGVIPQSFVRDTFENGDAAAWARGASASYLPGGRYRNKWYIKTGSEQVALAIGIHGQWLYVNRDRNVAIVKQSSQPKAVQGETDQMLMACFDAIASSLD